MRWMIAVLLAGCSSNTPADPCGTTGNGMVTGTIAGTPIPAVSSATYAEAGAPTTLDLLLEGSSSLEFAIPDPHSNTAVGSSTIGPWPNTADPADWGAQFFVANVDKGDSTTGTMVFTAVAAHCVSGNFTMTMTGGDTVTGSFDALSTAALP